MADTASIADSVLRACDALGFALAGIVEARPTDRKRELLEWLGAGRHGSMEWLAKNVAERSDPAVLLPGARSIVMVADFYGGRSAAGDGESRSRGRIARYARGDDYHVVMKERLHRLCDDLRAAHPSGGFRAFVDTAPVLEREHALRAGLGWIGKHTLLIHPELGSWMLLGGVITTLEIVPSRPRRVMEDHCGTCTRCIDACPTRAITPYSVDARACISYLTIEHRSMIPAERHGAIGDWIFGCDICQEVCPHNREREPSPPEFRALPAYTARRSSFDLLEILGWRDEDRRRALKGSAMKRAKLDMLKRNALIAAGNAVRRAAGGGGEAAALRRRIEELALDAAEGPLVQDTAREVLAGLAREDQT